MEVISWALLLLIVIDPIGNIPVFLSVLRKVPEENRRNIIIRECLIALIILLVFLFAGEFLLDLMQVKQACLGIGGGIMLLLISLRMIFRSKDGVFGDIPEGAPLIVPLAVPFMAGPSSMSLLLVLASRWPARTTELCVSLLIAWAISVIVLVFSEKLMKVLGEKGVEACERLMGMILVLVAVQMFMNGIGAFFNISQ